MNEKLNIKEEFFSLSEQLFQMIKSEGIVPKMVIGISGESGSGKSVTAYCLSKVFEQHQIPTSRIQMDDYFHLPAKTNHENRLLSFDHIGPQEVNLDLLDEHILAFKEARDVTGPFSNFAANTLESHHLAFAQKEVLIVEGTYIPLLQRIPFYIFIDKSYLDTLENRLSRGRESFDPFVEQVLKIEHEIISSFKAKADIVIDKNYQPYQKV